MVGSFGFFEEVKQGIDNGKSVSVPLGAHFKVSLKDCLLNDWDMERMSIWRIQIMPKIIISRDVMFNESLMYKDTLKGVGAAYSGKEVEFEVELQGSKSKENNYLPARYRDEGNVSLSRPSRSKVDDMAAYAFAIAEKEDTHEPITFHEAINSSEKDEWVHAMEEEMSSLMKNHTWEWSINTWSEAGKHASGCLIKDGIEGILKTNVQSIQAGSSGVYT
ncbi:retrovirus-related pol polyprotein from transposon TNT 1-94 [Tanacetum coccineum]|uniref:Retrovirus-related pol polyprotein from transposon TNT 1-94 n=1 Tax=Tanacetum coccineum TaxID=301880 RepID=A0ABQ5F504_9ASTR